MILPPHFVVKKDSMILAYAQSIITPIFGSFEREEFKKFLKLGAVFSAIIGSYWTLGTIKEALVSLLIGSAMLPHAKAASLICLIPMLMLSIPAFLIIFQESGFFTSFLGGMLLLPLFLPSF